MLKENEIAFLSQVALGVFSVDNQGRIWRHKEWAGGSPSGVPSSLRALEEPKRAERSVSQGYLKVMFTLSKKRYQIYAHRAVWLVLRGEPIPDGLEMNHKDGNPTNNSLENLEIVTRQQNVLHAGRVLRVLGKKPQRGEQNASAKLTNAQVLEIRHLWQQKTMTQSALAAHYGVSQGTISAICLRKTWTHLPQEFLG
jgi:DNA-binding transcriptional regulator YiaG